MFINIWKFIKKIGVIRLFFAFSLLVFVVFVLRYFSIRKEWKVIYVQVVPRNWVTTYNPYGPQTPFWISAQLQTGQKELDFTGKPIAEVLKIDKYERGGEDTQVFLTIRVQTSYNRKLDRFLYKGVPLDVGSPIELRIGHTNVLGQVIDNNYPPEGYPKKNMIVTVRAWRLEPWIFEKISTASAVYNTATKEVVAQVLDYKTEDPLSYLIANTYDYSPLTITKNPRIRDLIMKIRLQVVLRDDRWYFTNLQQVKMGQNLWFRFNNIDLNGVEVMDIQDEPLQKN